MTPSCTTAALTKRSAGTTIRRPGQAAVTETLEMTIQAASSPRPANISEKSRIRSYAQSRRIERLVHFTRAENVESIVLRGLYPIELAEHEGLNLLTNDLQRLDGHRDASSLSISTPNGRMLYKYHQVDLSAHWAVLILRPDILWEKNCAFCRHNAADRRISSQPISSLVTVAALEGMFEGDESEDSNYWLRVYDPIDEQAEVLVFDVIEPHYIQGIAVAHESTAANFPAFVRSRLNIICDKYLMSSREYVRMRGIQSPFWS